MSGVGGLEVAYQRSIILQPVLRWLKSLRLPLTDRPSTGADWRVAHKLGGTGRPSWVRSTRWPSARSAEALDAAPMGPVPPP